MAAHYLRMGDDKEEEKMVYDDKVVQEKMVYDEVPGVEEANMHWSGKTKRWSEIL